jgi:hypothetical protein
MSYKESFSAAPGTLAGSGRAFFSNKRKNLGLCQWGNSCQYSVQMPTASTEKVRELAAPALCKCLRVTMLATGTYLRTTPDRVPGRVSPLYFTFVGHVMIADFNRSCRA